MEIDAVSETYYTIRGMRYARVTEVLRARGLTDSFDGIPKRDREFYFSRGTANHKLWQDVEEGTADRFDYDPRVEAYRAGHACFLRDTGFKALPGGIELRVKATWKDLGIPGLPGLAGIAGCLDRLGTIQDRVVLIDFKTSNVPDSCAIQTALYLMCLPGYKFGEVERYGVGFKNDGTYRMSQRYPNSDYHEAMSHIEKYLKGEKQ